MLKKNKGFTLIELLAIIAIIGILMAMIVPEITKIVERSHIKSVENSARGLMKAIGIVQKEYALEHGLKSLVFSYNNGKEESNIPGLELDYTGKKLNDGKVVMGTSGRIALVFYDGTYCIEKEYESEEIIVTKKPRDNCNWNIYLGDISGANPPYLLKGMTPVVWSKKENDEDYENGIWITASNIDEPIDQNWYDYENKKWANAITEDGSMWVWIPRYAYKMNSGYHKTATGSVNIQFLKGKTNENKDNIQIETTGYDVESNNTSMNYFLHPSFDFDGGQLTGFWVAKFEPSENENDEYKISILPGKSPLVNQSINIQYNISLDMKSYICNNKCDTHMMKNIEWGSVAYLATSKYGYKLIEKNPIQITGGGDYNLVKNQKQSTTGNIYGVYDMSGGAYEYVYGYNAKGLWNEEELSQKSRKYIDIYLDYDGKIYGDAVYETSRGSVGNISWYGQASWFPETILDNRYFLRGKYNQSENTGIFAFDRDTGKASEEYTFRPVIIP